MKFFGLLLLTVFALSQLSYAEVVGKDVEYTESGTTLKGYLAYDNSIEGKRPGVLVVHEWWGHNDYARKRADMLAEMGYTALAVDMYGDGKQADHPDDANKFMMEVLNNMDVGEKRFNAAMDFLKAEPTVNPDQIAAIGYCFGGGVVLHMARKGTDLDGVVSFHGSLASMHTPEPGSVKAKVLVLHGKDDKFTTPEQLAEFRKEMNGADVDYALIVYPGVGHSFTNPAADEYAKKFEIPLVYDKDADESSWKSMEEFLKEIFKSESN